MLVSGERFAAQCLIYGLVDPREPERIRYVGKTTQAPSARYIQHLQTGVLHGRTGYQRRAWLGGLQRQGVRPWMVLLERVDDAHELDAREHHWIRMLQGIGEADSNARAPRAQRDPVAFAEVSA